MVALMRVLRWLILCVVLGLLALPITSATSFTRTYEASSAYVYGGPGQGGAFVGTAFCNRDTETVADTGVCVRYHRTGAGGYDHRGGTFSVTLTDMLFGSSTWFIVGFDLNGDSAISCTAGEPCHVGQGTITGTVPSSGSAMWVFPATVKSSGFFCCPESFATRGQVSITLT